MCVKKKIFEKKNSVMKKKNFIKKKFCKKFSGIGVPDRVPRKPQISRGPIRPSPRRPSGGVPKWPVIGVPNESFIKDPRKPRFWGVTFLSVFRGPKIGVPSWSLHREGTVWSNGILQSEVPGKKIFVRAENEKKIYK
jgi:hypothetical protein